MFAAMLLCVTPMALDMSFPQDASAVLSSPNAKIARTSDAALRRSIPAYNGKVAKIQAALEDIQFKLRIPQRKPWKAMSEDLDTCITLAADEDGMLQGVLTNDTPEAQNLLSGIQSDFNRLSAALALKDPDRTSIRIANALERVANLELLQAPGITFRVPAQYANLPCLNGRAIVQLEIKRKDGTAVFVDPDGGLQRQLKLELTVDGYSAPITAGNFVYNVMNGVYDGEELSVNPISVLIGKQGKDIGALPLEMLPVGDLEPVYRSPLNILEGELPVLPLSINGAVAYTHLPGADSNVGYVSSRQFFFYLYNRQRSGLSGLSFDEGQFPVFGYVTKGVESLSKLADGDVLVSARVVKGADKLILPVASSP